MAVLKKAQRRSTATVKVRRKTSTGKTVTDYKFPIPDAGHAKAALARLNQANPPLTPAQKSKVRAKAKRILGKGRRSK